MNSYPSDDQGFVDETKSKNDLVREQLVAYLDGELSDEQSQAIEQQISEDNLVRKEIQSLDQAWNALDALPLESTDHNFTQSTIAMVTMAATDDVVKATAEMPVLRKKRRWGTAITFACFACAGFLVSNLFGGYKDRQLIRDLPEIRYAKTLNQIGDLEFLEAWKQEASQSVPATSLANLQQEAETWQKLASALPIERYQWIDSLPPEELSKLSDKSTSFNALTDVKQDRLRRLNKQLNDSEEATALRRYALLYEQLVAKLPSIEQASLRDMPYEERIIRMQKELRRQRGRMQLMMTEPEQQAFRNSIEEVLKRIDEVSFKIFDAAIRERYRKFHDGKDITKDQLLLVKLKAIMMHASRPNSNGKNRMPLISQNLAVEQWESYKTDLLEALPPRVSNHVKATENENAQSQLILSLIRNTWQSTSPTDASAYFAKELSKKEQLEYLSMPKEEMQEELEEQLSAEIFEDFGNRGDSRERRRREAVGRGPNGEGRQQDREPPGFGPNARGPREGNNPRDRNEGNRGPRRRATSEPRLMPPEEGPEA